MAGKWDCPQVKQTVELFLAKLAAEGQHVETVLFNGAILGNEDLIDIALRNMPHRVTLGFNSDEQSRFGGVQGEPGLYYADLNNRLDPRCWSWDLWQRVSPSITFALTRAWLYTNNPKDGQKAAEAFRQIMRQMKDEEGSTEPDELDMEEEEAT